MLCTSSCRCRVLVESYTYEQCPLITGVFGYSQTVQTYTHARTQLHLVRVSLARAYTTKINTTQGFIQFIHSTVIFSLSSLHAPAGVSVQVDLNAIVRAFPSAVGNDKN